MSVQDSIEIFCQNIRWRREKAGMSVPVLAERSGLPLEMMEELERGLIPKRMKVTDAIPLAKVFGCEVYELFQ